MQPRRQSCQGKPRTQCRWHPSLLAHPWPTYRRRRTWANAASGAAARKSIGITVFSGMLASTILAVALVPVFYVLVAQWQARLAPKSVAATASH